MSTRGSTRKTSQNTSSVTTEDIEAVVRTLLADPTMKESFRGEVGKDGKDGKNGKDGKDGKDGKEGPPGPVGPVGKQGPQGKTGLQGTAAK